MRHSILALPALLSALVVAVPSPSAARSLTAAYEAQSQQQLRQPSRWKSWSDRLIASVFGVDEDGDERRRHHTLSEGYGDDLLLRFNISDTSAAASLAEAADTLLLDIWSENHRWMDIRLSRKVVPSLLSLLPESLQQAHTPLMREGELAKAIYETYPHYSQPRTAADSRQPTFSHEVGDGDMSGATQNIFFADYQPLSVITPWMQLMASLFTTHVRLIDIGKSYEERSILGLRVGVHPTNDNEEPTPRKTVLITGGSHAREWISTSTVLYVAYSLITSYGKTPDVTKLLEEYDFVFVPTLNPDGYEYTFTTDRLWRKNRQATSVRWCRGIDLDHAFGFEWSNGNQNPCSESYAGNSAFEGVESRRLADWARREVDKNNIRIVSFLDLHSYSQQILYPYSYSCMDTPRSLENLEELALGMSKAIRTSASHQLYEVLSACNSGTDSSSASGGSALDYAVATLQVPYAYTLKLRDRGTYGFLLPKEHIVPVGREILAAVTYLGAFLQEGYPKLEVLTEL